MKNIYIGALFAFATFVLLATRVDIIICFGVSALAVFLTAIGAVQDWRGNNLKL
jgi:hypothetical protein